MQRRHLPEGWDQDLPSFPADEKGLAGRIASGKVLNAIAQRVPWLIGGAADLAPSTNTRLTFEGAGDFSAENYAGRNFHFGVREHAMGAVLNGMSLSKIRAYGSGFLIFSDYARPAIRLSALMEIPTIHIFTHDFDRRRRGRPDASAGGAAGLAAGDPGADRDAPGGRQRGGRGVAGHHAAAARARGAGPDAAEPADARPRRATAPPPGSPGAPTSWRTPKAASRTCC